MIFCLSVVNCLVVRVFRAPRRLPRVAVALFPIGWDFSVRGGAGIFVVHARQSRSTLCAVLSWRTIRGIHLVSLSVLARQNSLVMVFDRRRVRIFVPFVPRECALRNSFPAAS
jgi:hypothetical protein